MLVSATSNRLRMTITPRQPSPAPVNLETLESRRLLSATTVSPEPIEVGAVPGAAAAGGFAASELLVGFAPGTTNRQIAGLYKAHGLAELEQLYAAERVRRVSVPDVAMDAVLNALNKNPIIEYAEPNYIATTFFKPNDPYYRYQWHLSNASYGGIAAEQAWDTATGGGAVVAVLDTGVAYENYQDGTVSYYLAPDLSGTHFASGYDFINNDAHANDDHSHGTHVAGTIAQSTNNSTGVAGVAFDASIMPVKVLGKNGSGSYSAIANGIRWAADNGAHVMNLSLGASSPSQTLEDALAYAYGRGVTIVAAAGNDGQNGVSYPAAYDEYVIAVSATRFDERLAPYSNYGSSIDLAAPGGDTSVDQNGDGYGDGVLQQTFNPTNKKTSSFGYYFFQGTSMAAPHVAGVAALLVSKGVSDPAQVRETLQSTAEDKGASGTDIYYGHGIVDAAAALAGLNSSNAAPVALDDTASADEDSSVLVNVLTNDSDADGDLLSVTAITQPSNGSATINADGTIIYSPGANYHGSDSFTYTISDGKGGSDTATVAVTVNPVNDAPVAGDDSATTEKGAAVTVNVLANDWDVDGGVLSISGFDSTSANGGTITDNGDGTLTYTPATGYAGSDSFGYVVADGQGGSTSAVVTIDVRSTTVTMHVGDLDGSSTIKGKSGKWEAFVTARVYDSLGQPVGGATVTGTWSGSATGTISGTTGSDGSVTFASSNIQGGDSVTFTVDTISGELAYSPADNHDPDGDSSGSSITVNRNGTTSSAALAASRLGSTAPAGEHDDETDEQERLRLYQLLFLGR